MSLFALAGGPAQDQGNFSELQANVARQEDGLFDEAVGKAFAGIESASAAGSNLVMLENQFEDVKSSLSGMTAFAEIGEAGIESAARSAMMLSNVDAVIGTLQNNKDGLMAGLESFAKDDLVATRAYSIGAAALIADNTNTLSDFLFPVMEFGATFGSVELTVTRYVIENNRFHAETGVTEWDRRHLADTAQTEGLLGSGQNLLCPVVTGANAASFVSADKVAYVSKSHENGTAFNTTFIGADTTARNLITLSQSTGVDADSSSTILDRINDGVSVSKIVVGLGAAVDNQAWILDLGNVASSKFGKVSNSRSVNDRSVNMQGVTVTIDTQAGTSNGLAIDDVAVLKAFKDAGVTSIGIRVTLNVNLNLHTGTFQQSLTDFAVVDVRHPNHAGNAISEYASEATAVKPVYLGLSLDATLSSRTIRVEGRRLGTEAIRKEFTTTTHAPITSETTIAESGTDAVLNLLAQGVVARRDEEALAHLQNDFTRLHAEYGTGNSYYDAKESSMFGLSFISKPYIKEVNVDIAALVAEQDSSNRRGNLQAALMGTLASEATLAVKGSNLIPVHRMYLKNDAKISMGIVGDSNVTRYLHIDGEDKSFGANDDILDSKPVIMACNYESIADTLYMFVRSTSATPAARALGYGFAIASQPIVVNTELDRNGAKTKVLQIHPTYKFITSTPVLVKFNVAGLEEYFKQKSTVVQVSA